MLLMEVILLQFIPIKFIVINVLQRVLTEIKYNPYPVFSSRWVEKSSLVELKTGSLRAEKMAGELIGGASNSKSKVAIRKAYNKALQDSVS